jgi:hypothetical protein
MNLQHRIEILEKLGKYILSDDVDWMSVKEKAARENNWFIPEFIELSTSNIAKAFLNKRSLQMLADEYAIKSVTEPVRNVGIVMAGNIPLVGFHDFLCTFLSGHRQTIKASAKDQVLIRHIVEKLEEWAPETRQLISFSEMLKSCDAYIATGSNNSSAIFNSILENTPILSVATEHQLLSSKEMKPSMTSINSLTTYTSISDLDAGM